MAKVKSWIIFIWERHNPAINIVFSILFFLAHYILAEIALRPQEFAVLLAGVVLFFFKLRLFDDLKDYDYDTKAHPDRPLVRGVISSTDLHKGIAVSVILEFFIFGLWGFKGLLVIAIANVYGFLMFKEFFLRRWIRPKLVTYAVTHTFVVVLLSIAVFSTVSSKWFWQLDASVYSFAMTNWFLFNIYEFSRKSFVFQEENPNADSYSKKYGRSGAASLVAMNSLIATYLSPKPETILMLGIIIAAGTMYVLWNKQPFGKLFRSVSNLFVIGFYLSSIINH